MTRKRSPLTLLHKGRYGALARGISRCRSSARELFPSELGEVRDLPSGALEIVAINYLAVLLLR